jgi:hypothetical protein
VFFHAMAMENIAELKGNVKLPREHGRTNGWLLQVYAIAFVCFLLVACWRLGRSVARPQEMLILLAGVVCIAIVEFFVLNLAPSNWVGTFVYVWIVMVTGAHRRLAVPSWSARLIASISPMRRAASAAPAGDRSSSAE